MADKLGLKLLKATLEGVNAFDSRITDMYAWIDEYMTDAKKSFNT